MHYPISTYRVQLHSGFTFTHLQAIIPYLHQLGVSTIYASPITRAIKGSAHGYDVAEPHEINPEIGTLDQLRAVAAQLKALGMNWLQDIVPNHMAFSMENTRLADVLERGNNSPYYAYFDINWEHDSEQLKGKVLVPVLGSRLDDCIDNNEIQLGWDVQGPGLYYAGNRYPVSGGAVDYLFGSIEGLEFPLGAYSSGSLAEWQQAKKEWLHSVALNTALQQQIRNRIEEVNASASWITEVVKRQWYLPACWKEADTGMNYRRFFAVNSLISVRMEEPWVFDDYHRLIAHLYAEGLIQGVRIDHIDGLYNPYDYVQRLRKLLGDDCYIIAEKILEYNEQLPAHWPLQGTSGYEFLSYTNRVLTSTEGAAVIYDFYHRWVPDMKPYKQLVFANKLSFLERYLHGEWDMLTHKISEWELLPATYRTEKLAKALGIWMAAFPVYRIYPHHFPLSTEELEQVQHSLEFAVMQEPAYWEELAEIRTLFHPGDNAEQNARKMQLLNRLMQFTGPLAAKGVEDTTFYVYNPLISHNEVGDSPEQAAVSIEAFHEKMQQRRLFSNYSLNTTSTHDTKRGEDARMRINVLTELSDEWMALVKQWHIVNAPYISTTSKGAAPSMNDEYFIYQSLIGSFPEDSIVDENFTQRSEEFILKALREAKVNTTYTEHDEDYEKACVHFITGIVTQPEFLKTFLPFLKKVTAIAEVYSLVQLVIKATVPGIPDIYQGCELWDTSYVDPDNRRPVNYDIRKQWLQKVMEKNSQPDASLAMWLQQQRHTGIEKLFVTRQVLQYRKQHAQLFSEGDYVPLPAADNSKAIVYARIYQQQWALVVLPVGLSGLKPESLQVPLPATAPAQWKEVFTGRQYMCNAGVLELQDWQYLLPVVLLEPA
ncbi:maltooligosyl trehalose synthase [Filimonas lacunae]|uniref:Maltooligosyl trehalose synthase n=1 Tax=Filimonas lacunae TaxID=477680 RepID=A0A173MN43_9BACT|nr:malto-oligosyltrehalose synthase [Filimonas lacunae]BAV08889.1 malto-oligosyltrehalose synthase [Filimonas lacunae]SIS63431.1 maltooligosyl trehalose synthase [Filimonas lacunae]